MIHILLPTLPLATALGLAIGFLQVLMVICCLMIVLLVLLQRPKDQGLGTAFGGEMAENILGTQATDVLQKGTIWFGSAFAILAVVVALLYARELKNEREGNILPTTLEAAAAAGATAPAAEEGAAAPAAEEGAAAPEGTTPVEGAAPESAPATESAPALEEAPATPVLESAPAPEPVPTPAPAPAPATEEAAAPAESPAPAVEESAAPAEPQETAPMP